MPKRKLKRFAEIKTYANVIEPQYSEIINNFKFKVLIKLLITLLITFVNFCKNV